VKGWSNLNGSDEYQTTSTKCCWNFKKGRPLLPGRKKQLHATGQKTSGGKTSNDRAQAGKRAIGQRSPVFRKASFPGGFLQVNLLSSVAKQSQGHFWKIARRLNQEGAGPGRSPRVRGGGCYWSLLGTAQKLQATQKKKNTLKGVRREASGKRKGEPAIRCPGNDPQKPGSHRNLAQPSKREGKASLGRR